MAKKPDLTTIGEIEGSENDLNSNFTAIRDAFDNTVSRDGSTPNSMSADLDMNSNDILNVGDLTVGGVSLSSQVDAAEGFADDAEASATAAATSETNAATSETNAAASETKAEQWAEEDEDVAVEAGKFSAFHWAQKSEAFSATNTVLSSTTTELTVGYSHAVHDLGTTSSGTVTPDEADGAMQKTVNGGAFTLAPPTNDTSVLLKITNNASAGTITTSGFTIVTGDSFTTTDTEAFLCTLNKIDGSSHLHVTALQ